VGWISRKHLASGRGRTFFLTSLLIELIDPIFSEQKAQTRENACLQQLIASVGASVGMCRIGTHISFEALHSTLI
jgi:hypothetical protein